MAKQKITSFLTSEEIFDLGDKLQKLGLFVVDTQHLIQVHHAQDVLVALQVAGEQLTIDRLKTILAPIFCGTPEQQSVFYSFFEDWIKCQPEIIQRFNFEITEKAKEIPIWLEKPKRHWLGKSVFALALALVTVVIFFIFRSKQQPQMIYQSVEKIGKVIDGENNVPVSNASVFWRKDTLTTDEAGCFLLNITEQDSVTPLNIEHPQYLGKSVFVNFNRIQDTLSIKDTLSITIRRIEGTQVFSKNNQLETKWEQKKKFIEIKSTQSLLGQVKNTNDLRPISGASVLFLNQQVITNSQGRFQFKYEPKDSAAQIIFNHPDYFGKTIIYRINGNDRNNVEILLRSKSTAEINSLRSLVDRINAFAVKESNQPKLKPWQKILHQYFPWLRLGSFALPLIIFIGWLIVRWFRRRIILERITVSRERKTESVMVKGKADYLYRNAIFRRMVQRYRLHREEPSTDLDVPATVEATIRQGGLFFPHYAFRNVLPQYLVLIDRTSFTDQHATMLDSLVQRMRSDGVIVDRYFFDDDPRICQSDKSYLPFMTLKELLARHPQHRLLIFSDADHFIDIRTGKPQAYLEQFLAWSDPAIFIPDKSEGAEYLEMKLKDMGFHINSANLNGLIRHIDALYFPMATEQAKWQHQHFPALLQDRLDIWLERQPPDTGQIDLLIQQLKIYLGAEAMYWLCACAVYPELHWELTLYLATRLNLDKDKFPSDEQQEKLQQQLLDLTRLPWFRYGVMPDWLRLRLITELSSQQHQAVRRELRILLESARQEATESFRLEFVRRTSVDPLWEIKLRLFQQLGLYYGESPLRDYIFSNYISGGKPGLLTVLIPEKVRRNFFHSGQVMLGVRPVAVLVLTFLLSMLGGLGLSLFKLAIAQPFLIPTFHVVETKRTSDISATIVKSDSIIESNQQITSPAVVSATFIGRSDSAVGYYVTGGFSPVSKIFFAENFASSYHRYRDWLKNILKDSVAFNDFLFAFALELSSGSLITETDRIDNDSLKQSRLVIQFDVGISFVFIPGGTFDMGDTFGDGDSDEKPVHHVTVSDFYMSKTEVTKGQFRKFIEATGYSADIKWEGSMSDQVKGSNKSKSSFLQSDDLPEVDVSWSDAVAFCQWTGYRLPTEAEWEYASRDENKKMKWSGVSIENLLGDYAWYRSNSGDQTHPVSTKKPNALGLFDLSGNVWEWCSDWYDENYYQNSPKDNPKGPAVGTTHVLRGGSLLGNPWICRSTNRLGYDPDYGTANVGFRVVHDSPP